MDDIVQNPVKHFAKIVNRFQRLIIFTKLSILDIWQCSEYVSEPCVCLITLKMYFDSELNYQKTLEQGVNSSVVLIANSEQNLMAWVIFGKEWKRTSFP